VRATWAELLGIARRATLAAMLDGSTAVAAVYCGGWVCCLRAHTAVKTVDADQRSKQLKPTSVGLAAYTYCAEQKLDRSSVDFLSSRWLWFWYYFLATVNLSVALDLPGIPEA